MVLEHQAVLAYRRLMAAFGASTMSDAAMFFLTPLYDPAGMFAKCPVVSNNRITRTLLQSPLMTNHAPDSWDRRWRHRA